MHLDSRSLGASYTGGAVQQATGTFSAGLEPRGGFPVPSPRRVERGRPPGSPGFEGVDSRSGLELLKLSELSNSRAHRSMWNEAARNRAVWWSLRCKSDHGDPHFERHGVGGRQEQVASGAGDEKDESGWRGRSGDDAAAVTADE